MTVYVFPGQGSQRKRMGEHLFDEFADLVKQADNILGYSIKELCLNNPDRKLNQTQYTQVAMYVVNALSYMKKIQEVGNPPDFMAGHSLGEYNALQAAGVFSFQTGLKLVEKRGRLMSKAKKGAMAAVIKLSESKIRKILANAELTGIDIANLNAPEQIVISGLKDDINKSQSYFEKEDAIFIPLNTSGAFHSRYMQEAGVEFKKYVDKFEFSPPQIPVISNVTGRPYEPDQVSQNLVDQITHCVRWMDSIYYLLDQDEMLIEEMGVGDVLTKLVGQIRKDWSEKNKALEDQTESEIKIISTAKEEAKKDHVQKHTMPDGQTIASGEASALALETATVIQEKKSLSVQELVEHWNQTYPIGTKVSSVHYERELETRTEAIILFGHRAAIYMKGYNGYFDLREITPKLS
jgi:malonyl CoA-acyl carrier protein transacylase